MGILGLGLDTSVVKGQSGLKKVWWSCRVDMDITTWWLWLKVPRELLNQSGLEGVDQCVCVCVWSVYIMWDDGKKFKMCSRSFSIIFSQDLFPWSLPIYWCFFFPWCFEIQLLCSHFFSKVKECGFFIFRIYRKRSICWYFGRNLHHKLASAAFMERIVGKKYPWNQNYYPA